jgi:uncharacterized membrane protein YphA (DoxX/SURF4 family)
VGWVWVRVANAAQTAENTQPDRNEAQMTNKPTAPSAALTGTTTTRRGFGVTLWVLQLIAAVLFAVSGFFKISGEAQSVTGFAQIGAGDWFRYLIGALEIVGAIALVIPLLSGIAGLVFSCLMLAAVITQFVMFDGDMIVFPGALLVVSLIIAWGRRPYNVQLWKLLRRN